MYLTLKSNYCYCKKHKKKPHELAQQKMMEWITCGFKPFVMFHITDPTPSPSPPETFHRRIVDHQHYQLYAPFFCPDNSCLGLSPPAPYHKQNHHYPILRHFTCQWTPSNTCITIQHLGLWLRTEQIPYDSISFTTRIFHFTICLFHIIMWFLIFDIPFSCARCHITNLYVSASII